MLAQEMLARGMLAEVEQEAAITRKFLERLPEDKLTWKPHERSMTAGQLAFHLATIPGNVAEMLQLDTMPPPDFSAAARQPESKQQVLDGLGETLTKVRAILPTFTEEKMQGMWTIEVDGNQIMAMPRAAALRMIMLSHWIQHRGQFSVYLRLLGQKVPSSYGPSADELPDFMQQAQGA